MKCINYFDFICCDANEIHKHPKIEKIKVIDAPSDNGTYTLSDYLHRNKPFYEKNTTMSLFFNKESSHWVIFDDNNNKFVSQLVICPLTKWKENLNNAKYHCSITKCEIKNNFYIVDDDDVNMKPAKI